MRAFIAIEIPNEIHAALAVAQEKLKRAAGKVSWTNPANIHLTLKFLGEISVEKATDVQTALSEIVTHYAPFSIAVSGAGGFPSARAPRVLWIGCDEPTRVLLSMQGTVESAIAELGFPTENRDFAAHLTLGRIKFPKPDPALTSALDSLKNETFGTVTVDAIHLFESQLRPTGAVYTKISSHPLAPVKK